MKSLRQPILLSLLGLFALIFSGCTSGQSTKDSSIPWGRPSGWEGQIPGMGSTQGSGTR